MFNVVDASWHLSGGAQPLELLSRAVDDRQGAEHPVPPAWRNRKEFGCFESFPRLTTGMAISGERYSCQYEAVGFITRPHWLLAGKNGCAAVGQRALIDRLMDVRAGWHPGQAGEDPEKHLIGKTVPEWVRSVMLASQRSHGDFYGQNV